MIEKEEFYERHIKACDNSSFMPPEGELRIRVLSEVLDVTAEKAEKYLLPLDEGGLIPPRGHMVLIAAMTNTSVDWLTHGIETMNSEEESNHKQIN